jgi:RNA-binding protein
MLTAKDRRRLRQIAHHLEPVVIVAGKGLGEGVVQEVNRALTDHELIKVRVDIADRDLRRAAADELAARCAADIAQSIGKVWVLYRPNPEAKAKLSNLKRRAGSP